MFQPTSFTRAHAQLLPDVTDQCIVSATLLHLLWSVYWPSKYSSISVFFDPIQFVVYYCVKETKQ